MGKTNKCYLRENETLAEVLKNTNAYIWIYNNILYFHGLYDKSFPVLHLFLPSLKT